MANDTNKNDKLALHSATPTSIEESFTIPLHISDILKVCRSHSKLGWLIQSQAEAVLELGVTEAVDSGLVSIEALPHIKDFLLNIAENLYFGEASDQAADCIYLIDIFEQDNPTLFITKN